MPSCADLHDLATVQGVTCPLRQIVPRVVDDQVKLSAIGHRRGLVDARAPVLNTCT